LRKKRRDPALLDPVRLGQRAQSPFQLAQARVRGEFPTKAFEVRLRPGGVTKLPAADCAAEEGLPFRLSGFGEDEAEVAHAVGATMGRGAQLPTRDEKRMRGRHVGQGGSVEQPQHLPLPAQREQRFHPQNERFVSVPGMGVVFHAAMMAATASAIS
jgi:hypothetical protein